MVFLNSSARDTDSEGGPCVRFLGLVDGETPPSGAQSGVIERLQPAERVRIFINFSGQFISHSGE